MTFMTDLTKVQLLPASAPLWVDCTQASRVSNFSSKKTSERAAPQRANTTSNFIVLYSSVMNSDVRNKVRGI